MAVFSDSLTSPLLEQNLDSNMKNIKRALRRWRAVRYLNTESHGSLRRMPAGHQRIGPKAEIYSFCKGQNELRVSNDAPICSEQKTCERGGHVGCEQTTAHRKEPE